MRGASLLHGALLWETGIIKSLYYLLVTPNVIEGTRWEPSYEGTSILLGKFLMQFFYMAGGTLIPTKNNSSIA